MDRYDKLAQWIHDLKVLRKDMLALEMEDVPLVDRRWYRAYLGEADRYLDAAQAALEELEETR